MRSYPYHPDALGAAALAHRKLRALDAYEDNPLWQEYVKKDIIAKDKRGTPPKGEMMGDLQCYQ